MWYGSRWAASADAVQAADELHDRLMVERQKGDERSDHDEQDNGHHESTAHIQTEHTTLLGQCREQTTMRLRSTFPAAASAWRPMRSAEACRWAASAAKTITYWCHVLRLSADPEYMRLHRRRRPPNGDEAREQRRGERQDQQ
jgi:hypothetical protein